MAGTANTGDVGWQAVAQCVPEDAVRAVVAADEICGVQPAHLIAPGSEVELARVLAAANEGGVKLIPRGGGSKLAWGNPPAVADAVLSTERLSGVIEHAWGDMTVTVQAGTRFAALQRTLAEHGQRLALDPLWPERATIGGVIATNDSGPLRLRFGSVRDLIIGITVALPDGTLARSGGKVVKNVAGYDLPKLMTGSLGTLGVITEATFRLHPLPIQTRTLSFASADVDAANRFLLAVADSYLVPASVQLRTGIGMGVAVDVLLEGIEAGIEAQTVKLIEFAGATGRELEAGVWRSAQQLYDRAGDAAFICKLSVLPSQLSEATERISAVAGSGEWELVAQAHGLGLLRIEGATADSIGALRKRVVAAGGSLVVLRCTPAAKRALDAWGPCKTQQLALRVKQQFDGKGTSNPGRFVGGI